MRILMLICLCAVLFVGACVLGFVKNDPQTGAPSLTLEGIGLDGISLPGIDEISLPENLDGFSDVIRTVKEGWTAWPYGLSSSGLTIKTLHAGKGEAVLVCADGYTMLLGGGSGMGAGLAAQLLLCGVGHLNAVVAMDSAADSIAALPLVMTLIQPDYLIYQDSQTKGAAYNRLIETANKSSKTQMIVGQQGTAFMMGRAKVTVIGPARRAHTDERNDGLSVRIDYGNTSVLVMGTIAAAGEKELITARAPLDADVLIAALGGGEESTCQAFVQAASPSAALLTGREPANAVRVRLQRAGTVVYTSKEHGVMTVRSDGETISVMP